MAINLYIKGKPTDVNKIDFLGDLAENMALLGD
jgi:hypothetical protein